MGASREASLKRSTITLSFNEERYSSSEREIDGGREEERDGDDGGRD